MAMRELNEIEEFLEDWIILEEEIVDAEEEYDVNVIARDRRERRVSMNLFYLTRKDVLIYFDDAKVMRTFRFDRESIAYIQGKNIIILVYKSNLHLGFILELIEHLLPKNKTLAKRNLTPQDMVLIFLQFAATGTFQTVIGNVLRYSQSSVCRAVSYVSLALALISSRHITYDGKDLQSVCQIFRATGSILQSNLSCILLLLQMKRGFFAISGMPGVVGAVDGTHILITCPFNHEKAYVNRKNYHSLNVQVNRDCLIDCKVAIINNNKIQAICDENYEFLSVCATKPGSCHD